MKKTSLSTSSVFTTTFSTRVIAYLQIQGYSLKSTETEKSQVVSKLGYRVVFIYPWNGIVPSSRRTGPKFYFNHYIYGNLCRLVAESYFKRCCNTVRYTLENILVVNYRYVCIYNVYKHCV